jgi:hypothetical protein
LAVENPASVAKLKEVSMEKDGVKSIITMAELKAHSGPRELWFVVGGEGKWAGFEALDRE